MVSYGVVFIGGELLMSAKNKPGCGDCCVTEPGCHPDVEANPCTGTRLNPTMTITATALFLWVTPAEVGTTYPDISSAGWYYVENGQPVPEVPEGDWKTCTTCSSPVIAWNPYDPANGAPNGDASTSGVVTEGSCTCDNAPNTAPGLYDGHGCLKCLPRYRCATVVFTPNAYSTQCPGRFLSKMWYSCPYTWANANAKVGISLELYRREVSEGYGDASCECLYRVTVVAGDDVEIYDGIPFDDLGLQTYGVSTDEGDYAVTLGGASVVANPLASGPCPPCVCATCLPSGLLIEFQGGTKCSTAYYSCSGTQFSCGGYEPVTIPVEYANAPTDYVTITIGMTDRALGRCSLTGTISGLSGILPEDATFEIPIEAIATTEMCEPINLFQCRDVPSEQPIFFVAGTRGNGNCLGISTTGTIDHTVNIRSTTNPSTQFTLRIKDGSCNECKSPPECKGGCPSLKFCPIYPCLGEILSLSIDAPGCVYDGSGFAMVDNCRTEGNFGDPIINVLVPADACQVFRSWDGNPATNTGVVRFICVPDVPAGNVFTAYLYYHKTCPPDEVDVTGYTLILKTTTSCSQNGPFSTTTIQTLSANENSSCDPFVLEFDGTASPGVSPCVCCDAPGPMTIRITR